MRATVKRKFGTRFIHGTLSASGSPLAVSTGL